MRVEGRDLVELLAKPASVAVVGASSDPSRLSGRPLDYLRRFGFGGALHAVNPRADLPGVHTVRTASELPGVDVALVALPAPLVLSSLHDLAAGGTRAAVVIGSGFENRDGEPRRAIDTFASETDMRIIGPNCVGALGVDAAAYLTFSSVLKVDTPRPGRIGLVTQSGALGNSLLQTMIRRHVGLKQWISTGNEVDAGALELTTGLLESDGVDAVGLFLEGVTDASWVPRLESALQETGKHLFVLKAAHSPSGRQAAAGHTGRIVGSSDASDAILGELGARMVGSLPELADALVVAGVGSSLLRTKRPSIALVSVSGAAGVIGADRVAMDDRVRLADLRPDEFQLDHRLHVSNPLDVPFIDETSVFADAIVAMSSASTVDAVVGVESSLAHDRSELVAKIVASEPTVPVILTSLSEDDQIPAELTEALGCAGIAYLPTVERAAAAIAVCAALGERSAPDLLLPSESAEMGELRGLEWIAAEMPARTPWARSLVLDDPADAPQAVAELGLPVVVKAAGRTIEHRSELGAVKFVPHTDDLAEAVDQVAGVTRAHGDAVLLQAVAPAGFEVLVSVVDDPEFGPVAFVRPGGTLAELMHGQSVIWHRWSADRQLEVLQRSRLGQLLSAYRGGPTYDISALALVVHDLLVLIRTSELAFVELNPVLVHESGLTLIDAVGRSRPTAS